MDDNESHNVGDFRLVFYGWRFSEFGFLKSLTCRAVKQNRVFVGLPDGRQFNAAGAVQTKIHAAGSPVSHQSSFGHLENADLNIVFLAQRVRNKLS